jgi:hypothetical protein
MTNDEARMTKISGHLVIRHSDLALPLFMASVGADDVNAALAAHDFTVLANPLNARSNLHGAPPSSA